MSDNLSQGSGLTMALNSGALAEGTNNATIKITAEIKYILDGQFYAKAITDNIAIAYTGPDVYTAPTGVGSLNGGFTGGTGGSTRLYGIFLNAAGTVSILPGPIVNTGDLTAGRVSLQWPDVPYGVCPVGALRVALTAGTSFVPGTTDLSASGVTGTFYDLADMPAAPLTA